MDTTTRLFVKSITWQIMGLFSMAVIGFLFTNSIAASGGIAITGAIAGFIGYIVHEKLWSKILWGKK